jgi:hypothetical protein
MGGGLPAIAAGMGGGGCPAIATGGMPNAVGGTNWLVATCCCNSVSGNSPFSLHFTQSNHSRLTPGYHGGLQCLSLS